MKQLLFIFFLTAIIIRQQAQEVYDRPPPTDPMAMFNQGRDLTHAKEIIPGIYFAEGFANTFMVVTPDGNIIIDTSMPFNALRHKELLQAVDNGPVKYIILTHGHLDHRGGVGVWQEEGTAVIAHQNFKELRHYQGRLATFLARRGSAQFSLPNLPTPSTGNYGADIEADVFVQDSMLLSLGELDIHIYHTPGETPDHLSIWIPQLKAAFVGDNLYRSFPNIYTLRGTKPRWALEYVESINKILAWKPEVLIPSHGFHISGWKEIERRLTQYRDAILYVHDATVKGMNEGKSVYELMEEIRLPPHLDIGSTYGRIDWSVRGIYEGYAGWYDGNPVHMYSNPPSGIYSDLIDLAGGASKVIARAEKHLEAEEVLSAIRLLDIVLFEDDEQIEALKLKHRVLEILIEQSGNSNEKGWLRHAIKEIESKLD